MSDRQLLESIHGLLLALHAELEEFRPLLNLIKGNGGKVDYMTLAGLRRGRKP